MPREQCSTPYLRANGVWYGVSRFSCSACNAKLLTHPFVIAKSQDLEVEPGRLSIPSLTESETFPGQIPCSNKLDKGISLKSCCL